MRICLSIMHIPHAVKLYVRSASNCRQNCWSYRQKYINKVMFWINMNHLFGGSYITYDWFNGTVLTISQYFANNDYRFPCLNSQKKLIHWMNYINKMCCDQTYQFNASRHIKKSKVNTNINSLQWWPYDKVQQWEVTVISESNTITIAMTQQTCPSTNNELNDRSNEMELIE